MPDDNHPPAPGFTPTGYQRTQGGSIKWAPPSAEHLGNLLPQYEIEGLLGRGGMGAVYKARQKSLNRRVAIKILPPDVANSEEEMNFAERFKNEAHTMAKLNHPAIVHVYDYGETTEGQLYIVMEYIDGTDVARMISSQGRLPSEHALAITAHVCDALQYAHKHGVIHRDIKPANILIDMEGAVKVADFGLAKAMDAGQSGLTQTNMAVGTPDYVAPEALMSGITVDGRSDLYAVGVMLYAMLTGNVPRGSFPLPSKTISTDPRFDQIILKAMEMDRERRYQTAYEIRKDLDVILSTPHVEAGGKSSAAVPKQAAAASAKAQTPPAQKPVAKGPQQRPAQEAAPAASAQPNPKSQIPNPKSSSLGWVISTAVSAVVIIGGAFLMKGKTVVVTPAGEDEPAKPKAVASAAAPPIKVREEPKPVGDDVRSLSSKAGTTSTEPANAAQKSLVTSAPTTAPAIVSASPSLPISASSPPTPAVAAAPTPPPASPAPSTPSPPLPVSSSPAPPASELDQRLSVLESGFQTAVERDANAAFKASMAALDKLYLGALDRALAAATSGGKLEEAISLREEKQRIEKGEGVPSEVDESTQAPGKVPDTLKTLRKTYRSTTAQHEATKAKAMQPLYDKYDQALAAVQTELTKANQLDDAMRVKTLREQIAANRGGAAAPPAAANGPAPTSPPSTTLAGASAPSSASVFAATKDKPFTNSLGMKFVPVKGTDVLFCIHETRYKDYAAYATEGQGVDGAWKDQSVNGFTITERPGDHPVAKTSWEDAQAFCAWLSQKEGRLYRLPTDEEWSYAVGIGREEKRKKEDTPSSLHQKRVPDEYPWGTKLPPPRGAGNYSDQSRKAKAPSDGGSYLDGYDDGFPTTAPVMSFKSDKLGLYDLGGNVWEWCEDWYDGTQKDRVLRGGSWFHYDYITPLSSDRLHYPPVNRKPYFGFRVVLATSGTAPTVTPAPAPATKPAAPTPTPPVAPAPAPATAAKSDFTNSLGMKFVKVPGTKTLFCIHETRNGDYAKYAVEVPGVDQRWTSVSKNAFPADQRDSHPVLAVSYDDAQSFCIWLGKKEGRTYRLPSDEEWSYAVGIARKEKRTKNSTPQSLTNQVRDEYPWDGTYPPKTSDLAGNYSDAAAKAQNPDGNFIEGYSDGFVGSAPVMSFKPNKLGIYDMGGNAFEWCQDWWNAEQKDRTVRGGSFVRATDGDLLSSCRVQSTPDTRGTNIGFRIVLETTDK